MLLLGTGKIEDEMIFIFFVIIALYQKKKIFLPAQHLFMPSDLVKEECHKIIKILPKILVIITKHLRFIIKKKLLENLFLRLKSLNFFKILITCFPLLFYGESSILI